MRIGVLTSLYPSPPRPQEGIFAERRCVGMRERGHEVFLVHPIPHAPRLLAWGERGEYRHMPSGEDRRGVRIGRPRYLHLPRRALGNAAAFASAGCELLLGAVRPEVVVVELGGNDICNRDCVDPAHCANALYTDAEWEAALTAGLDKLVGFNHPSSLNPGATVYLLGVPRIQDLRPAGIALQQSSGSVNCTSFWSSFGVCEVATRGASLNGETLATRLAGVTSRVKRYNEILRDQAFAYASNENGRNPLGIEVVADYVNEATPSVGTTSFSASELNGGDCFHPNLQGQRLLATGAWSGSPRQ